MNLDIELRINKIMYNYDSLHLNGYEDKFFCNIMLYIGSRPDLCHIEPKPKP